MATAISLPNTEQDTEPKDAYSSPKSTSFETQLSGYPFKFSMFLLGQ